jgi:hypothetical protein
MGTPVVIVASGGIPVTETDNGTPLTVADNGFGIPVTLVGSRGIPVTIEGGAFVFTNAEAEAYVARMTVEPDDTRKGLIDALFTNLKAGAVSGSNLLTRFDALVLHKAHDQQAALLNAKSTSFTATLIGDPVFTANAGFTLDGVNDAIETNYNPTTAAGLFLQDSASFGYWENLNFAGGTASRAGWFDGTDGVSINPFTATGASTFRINQASSTTTSGGLTDSLGLVVAGRSASATVQFFKNGAVRFNGAGATSTPVNNATFNIGRITATGWAASNPWGYVIGGSMTVNEHVDLYNALNAYFSGF